MAAYSMVDLAQNSSIECLIILQIQNQQNWRKLLEYLANVLFDNHFDWQGNLFPSKIKFYFQHFGTKLFF
jgi:hypothetical protein